MSDINDTLKETLGNYYKATSNADKVGMKGYTKPSRPSAISPNDNVMQAIGKLEANVEGGGAGTCHALVPQVKAVSRYNGDMTVELCCGETSLTTTPENGVYLFDIPFFGEWTITVSQNGKIGYTKKINVNEIKQYQLDIAPGYRYGYRIKKAESDPYERVEYIYDAVGMTPARMNEAQLYFDYGDWEDVWFVKDNKPVMLDHGGSVAYYLNPNNYAYRDDGVTKSDITVTTTANVLNAMSQIPLCWVKRYEDDKYQYEIVSNVQYDEDYKPYAHTREDGSIADYFYWGIYKGCRIQNRIRSLSGQNMAQSLSAYYQIKEAKANGLGIEDLSFARWRIHSWIQKELIRTLLVLMGKSTNTQAVFGAGNAPSDGSTLQKTGGLNTKGQFFGNDNQNKVFHIESFWGNQWDRTEGVCCYDGRIYVCMASGGYIDEDELEVQDEIVQSRYIDTGISVSKIQNGFIRKTICSEYGMIPTDDVYGSDTTFYADQAQTKNATSTYLLTNGYNTSGGAFAFDLLRQNTYAGWHIGCGLSTIQPKSDT